MEIDHSYNAPESVTFVGNSNNATEVTHEFVIPLSARFVRLTMLEFVDYGAIRWAITGCPMD